MDINKKYSEKAKKIAKFLSLIPFVRMIALTGSLAKKEATADSDIDFFIATKSGRIWTARFLIVSSLKFLGQYRTEDKIAGKICPNCYQTEDALLVTPCNLTIAQEYSQIAPLFEINDTYQKFIKANSWIKKYNLKFKVQTLKCKESPIPALIRRLGEFILNGRLGNYLEEKLKEYQKQRILKDKRTYKEKSRIIISDRMLYFHPEGR